MKTRAGFVSNSSTSSFVVIGTKLTNKEYKEFIDNAAKKYEIKEEDDVRDCLDDLDWFIETEYETIVGYELASSDSDGEMSESELSLMDLTEKAKVIKELTGKKAKLITGTRMC